MSLVEYLVPFVSGGLTVVGVKLVGMLQITLFCHCCSICTFWSQRNHNLQTFAVSNNAPPLQSVDVDASLMFYAYAYIHVCLLQATT
jgi:hypothetical protein